MPSTWTLESVRHDPETLVYVVTNGNARKELYLTAGELAVLGRSGPSLFDGKPKKGDA